MRRSLSVSEAEERSAQHFRRISLVAAVGISPALPTGSTVDLGFGRPRSSGGGVPRVPTVLSVVVFGGCFLVLEVLLPGQAYPCPRQEGTEARGPRSFELAGPATERTEPESLQGISGRAEQEAVAAPEEKRARGRALRARRSRRTRARGAHFVGGRGRTQCGHTREPP